MAKCGMKAKMGRPTAYTPELGKDICHLLATTSLSLSKICASEDRFPHEATVYAWRLVHPDFHEMYTTARMSQADVRIDQCEDIALDCPEELVSINKARMIIDTRKWVASKVLPKVYGDLAKKETPVNTHEQSISALPNE